MIYKIVLTLLVIFSVKTFGQDKDINIKHSGDNPKSELSTKQLEMIVKSIRSNQ